MRRKDKEIIDKKIINEILEENNICRIALSENNSPYIFPMNYGYRDNKIYLHSAVEGKKIDIIKKSNNVCFEITDSIEVVFSDKACDFGTRYRSVIGFGKINIIEDISKRIKALEVIMKQNSKKESWSFSDNMLSKIFILEIEIESITGKISGF